MALKQARTGELSQEKRPLWERGFGLLNAQISLLKLYQWLWLLICMIGALAVALPRLLTQPLVYRAGAEVRLDIQNRYAELYTNGQPDHDFADVQYIALELLRARLPEFGAPTLSARFVPNADGSIAVIADGPTAVRAQELADESAETLARSVRAAGGREIMRRLLGWEQDVALLGNPPATPFQNDLRQIIRTSAFPLNRAVSPNPESFTVEQLSPEDLSDLARALEVRMEQLRFSDIPTVERQLAGASGPTLERLQAEQRRLREGQRALGDALDYLYNQRNSVFAPDAPTAAYRSLRASLPAAAEPRRIPELTLLAILLGLAFGAACVAVDRSAGVLAKLRELWAYRELIRNLVLRDLRARYKGSALGYLWTQLAPLLLMTVFWFVFSFFMDTSIAMFPIFLIVALLAWNFCAEAVTGGTRSVIDNANLIKKVFFPREVLPLVAVFSSLLNYLLSLPMMFLLMAVVQWFYGPLRETGHIVNFSWTFAYLPVLIVIQTMFLAGVALFLAALAVFFRDAIHLIGILVQFWFFLTPVVYSFSNVNDVTARIIRWLNPMASLIEFYRETLYGNAVVVGLVPTPGLPALTSVLRVFLTALAVLALGYWFFQRNSGRFGEEI
ncbi:MAG: ABC transporter permease [Chloroflexaceae bacterium]|jgi:lipopolysaccharide transport system permease protein|nr:ABC transporter permease [Chloroflexaceae bacterium]